MVWREGEAEEALLSWLPGIGVGKAWDCGLAFVGVVGRLLAGDSQGAGIASSSIRLHSAAESQVLLMSSYILVSWLHLGGGTFCAAVCQAAPTPVGASVATCFP